MFELTAFMLLYSATLLDIHTVLLSHKCWLVKLCHDSSVYYTLSDFSSRKQHYFGIVTA